MRRVARRNDNGPAGLGDSPRTQRWQRNVLRVCLAEEMLERQTDELESFLVTTSIFPILIPKASDALLGIDSSYEILQELARQNLAIEVSAPDEATAYVYHSLLRQLTRTRLHKREQDSLEELGTRAGDQLRELGHWEEALDIFSDVDAYLPAADFLVVVSETMAADKQWKKRASIVDLLPKSVKTSVPELAIRRAQAVVEEGDLVYALDEVMGQKEREDFARHMPWASLEQSNIKLHQSDTREAQSLIVEAQHLMETQDTDPEDALGMALSAHAETGNIGAAEHRYRTHRDLIQTELGEPPSPKMERLFQSLLSARSFSRTGTAFPIQFSTPVAPFYDRRT